jgi:hypothetical protein
MMGIGLVLIRVFRDTLQGVNVESMDMSEAA